ncbi:MAG: hypothetical protein ACK6BG_07110 [Cyanobacteriota bacterium]
MVLGLASLVSWADLSPPVRGQGPPVSLDCRVGGGPWTACRMEIQDPGRIWTLVVGRRRYSFQHDGTGRMRMTVDGRWKDVTPRWDSDGSLCWDGLCARGEIPLD